MSEKKKAREHAHEFEIAAPPAEVWKAITDAESLANWFPFEARVEPGPGGKIVLRWGPELECVCRVEVWEPERHLRTTWMEKPATAKEGGPGALLPLAVDWRIEGRKGSTILRLVHSGFEAGKEWDEYYDGTRRGWEFELRSLQLYLGRHRGERRTVTWVRRPTSCSVEEAWDRVTGPRGLRLPTPLPVAGLRMTLTTAAGDKFAGEVLACERPADLAMSLDSFGGALLRYGHETCFGRPEAQIWLYTWGVPASDLPPLRSRVEAMMGEALA
jgi:uncharacterized protein YndB with AHSA1/START domain